MWSFPHITSRDWMDGIPSGRWRGQISPAPRTALTVCNKSIFQHHINNKTSLQNSIILDFSYHFITLWRFLLSYYCFLKKTFQHRIESQNFFLTTFSAPYMTFFLENCIHLIDITLFNVFCTLFTWYFSEIEQKQTACYDPLSQRHQQSTSWQTY